MILACSLQVKIRLRLPCFYGRPSLPDPTGSCTGPPCQEMVKIHAATKNQAAAERRWAQFDTAIRRGKETHTSVWKSILKYCFIVELFEKWRNYPPPLAPHSGVPFWHLADQFGVSPRGGVTKSGCHWGEGGGGGLVCPLAGFPPNTRN